jgi:hypothetical protein
MEIWKHLFRLVPLICRGGIIKSRLVSNSIKIHLIKLIRLSLNCEEIQGWGCKIIIQGKWKVPRIGWCPMEDILQWLGLRKTYLIHLIGQNSLREIGKHNIVTMGKALGGLLMCWIKANTQNLQIRVLALITQNNFL